ncbi:MAG: circadian clock protein KaiB [Gammaproteobacteria bacterium]|nr:circadian clock protein KaiB [Gammaproteobacteria bacterium]
MSAKVILKLYLAGITADNQKMILNFKTLLTDTLDTEYTLEIVDIMENPELAVEGNILATPTIVKVLPTGPDQKMILDLEDHDSLSLGMALIQDKKSDERT